MMLHLVVCQHDCLYLFGVNLVNLSASLMQSEAHCASDGISQTY